MTIQAMRERRNGLAIEARKLLDDTKDKKWESEHQTKYDQLTGEISDLDARIEREQKVLDLAAEQHFNNRGDKGDKKPGKRDTEDLLSDIGIFDTWTRRGERGFTNEQAAKFFNTMSTTTGSEGGYTVPSAVASSLIESLKAFGGMRAVAEILNTAQGNPLSFPSSNGTAEEGEILAENAQATALDPSFGTVSLNVFKYSSKIIAVPIELLQDSSIDIEAFIRKRIIERVGRITNRHFTTGTGTGQPRGIVTASSSGKIGTTGQTLTVGYDDLVDLLESVDEAYQLAGSCKFMFAQTVRKLLRKLKDTAGRPIWTPGYEAGITAGAPDLLLGKEVALNNDMPAPAANAKSIIYGDLAKYMIRDAMQVNLMRFDDSAFASKGQVGFLAFMRSGGNLTDTEAVKHYQHSAT
ncbi:phage major capsid protein [Pseudomonas sp. HN2-3]|uniref:phage major capsid protein n=1 Tax=Pseudomonas sp. HN2-3 TaxID=2886360 RepID=UPI001D0FAA5A|nr:phage major capsid protein [Pseudomonas sp. HN2-3]UDU80100.1 phage major capsid protein [Pseudomonas sp. HN2-3]